jgi:hypothetical protein
MAAIGGSVNVLDLPWLPMGEVGPVVGDATSLGGLWLQDVGARLYRHNEYQPEQPLELGSVVSIRGNLVVSWCKKMTLLGMEALTVRIAPRRARFARQRRIRRSLRALWLLYTSPGPLTLTYTHARARARTCVDRCTTLCSSNPSRDPQIPTPYRPWAA